MNKAITKWSEIESRIAALEKNLAEQKGFIAETRSNSAFSWRVRALTTAQRDTLYPTPFDCLMVYNTTLTTFQLYYNGAWNNLCIYGDHIFVTTRVAASPYNVLAADHVIFVDTDGGAITVNLPAGIEGTNYRVINSGTSGNAVVLTPNGAEQLFKDAAATNLYDGEVADIVYNTTEGWQ